MALLAIVLTFVPGSACSDPAPDTEIDSPCRAFAAAPAPRWELDPIAPIARVRSIVSGSKSYALDDTGTLHVLAPSPAVALPLGADVRAVTVSRDGARLYVLRGGAAGALAIERFTSSDGGATFVPGSITTIAQLAAAGASATGGAITADGDILWVATPDSVTSSAEDSSSRFGKVLRITKDADVAIFARGFRSPSAIDVDPEMGDVWVVDAIDGGTEIDRVLEGKSYGWPGIDGLRCTGPATCARDAFLAPVFTLDAGVTSSAVVHRGSVAPLRGKLVVAGTELAALTPFGPSGPALLSKLAIPARAIGRGAAGELLVASDVGVSRIKDIAPAVPTSLVATGCFDGSAPSGLAAGAIAYDVASPLWSDGAEKSRFLVVPKGERGRALADGDLRFPVGTVTGKTFVVDGKKVETRLFIQHALETWTGYSYAWNDAGTDAELVVGNRRAALMNGKTWYFPSSDDCNACHTPAAGYTLGLEARQLTGSPAALAAIDRKLLAPVDRARFPALAGASTTEASLDARARGYLHANCSMCHRDGSATGLAELDLRIDTDLARTGLCLPPKAGAFDLGAAARVVKPKDPTGSVLLHRMKTLDEARMPKLASQVVDQEGVALLEQWIAALSTCP